MRTVTPAEAKAMIHDGAEIAFLDVRESGQFGEGHPFFACPCPFSRLELDAPRLVPRRNVRVLLIDAGDGVAAHGALALGRLGYTDVAAIEDGTPGWEAAGFTLYKGVNVPSKTLGELAEHAWHPATVDAQTLARWRAEGRPFRLYDARPPEEFAKMRVPGAICLPNGELAHRWPAVASKEPAVVTCAGRTRGITGVLGLRLVGIDAVALENGTQGWALAGQTLERGNTAAPFPELDAPARAATRGRADALLAAQGVAVADAGTVAAWRADPARTTVLLDLRSAPEVASDPAPAFAHAPSGQLVQATDAWVGIRHARLVLLDDLGLRAGIAAVWLRLLGFEVAVACIDDAFRALPPQPGPPLPRATAISAAAALRVLAAGQGSVVDVRSSAAYGAGHLAGALWGIRPRLDRLPLVPPVLVVGPDGVADLAARDIAALGHSASVVEGGHAALVAAGAVVESGGPDDPIDFLRFVHDRHDGNLEASRRYLDWEQGLVAQLDPAERAEFGL